MTIFRNIKIMNVQLTMEYSIKFCIEYTIPRKMYVKWNLVRQILAYNVVRIPLTLIYIQSGSEPSALDPNH